MSGVPAQWSSRFGFLMASVGFAVGLGNIWRFPYITGENGGSAFVVVYLLCAFAIGVPILMAEIMVGRKGGSTPPGSMRAVAIDSQLAPRWAGVGHLNLLTAFMILVTYSVVAGWVLYYLLQALLTGFTGVDAAAATSGFDALLLDIPRLVTWSLLALGVAGGIVYSGVEKGIERAVTVLMPLLFLLLVGLAVFNTIAGGMPAALDYLFTPDFSKVNPSMILAAVGQAFFSIGVAMAGMMMFGAYLPRHISIGRSAVIIVLADTAVALLAGLVIFPMVFNNGLDPAGGAGLIFKTLPLAFAQMPGGGIVATFFFLLLSVAAVTSIVGLLEPLCAFVVERTGWSRQRSVILLVIAVFAVSLVGVLSYNIWAHVEIFGASLGAVLDFLPNQIMLPLGGLFIAYFVGWRVLPQVVNDAITLPPGIFVLWRNLLRFVVVPAVLIIFISGVSE